VQCTCQYNRSSRACECKKYILVRVRVCPCIGGRGARVGRWVGAKVRAGGCAGLEVHACRVCVCVCVCVCVHAPSSKGVCSYLGSVIERAAKRTAHSLKVLIAVAKRAVRTHPSARGRIEHEKDMYRKREVSQTEQSKECAERTVREQKECAERTVRGQKECAERTVRGQKECAERTVRAKQGMCGENGQREPLGEVYGWKDSPEREGLGRAGEREVSPTASGASPPHP
jgi:hypothetical protein